MMQLQTFCIKYYAKNMLRTQRILRLSSRHSSTHEAKRLSKPVHQPVMVREVLDDLYPQKGDVILDMTFGGGGHTRAILDRCCDCKVIALDRDPHAIEIAEEMATEYSGRIVPMLGKFSELNTLLKSKNITSISGALIDAGCSSMQFDVPGRGFSLARDGPLDMRMDASRDLSVPTAADVVNRLSAEDLRNILEKYGDEKYARKIADRIVHYRGMEGPITRTRKLAEVVASAFHSSAEMQRTDALNRRCHIATKTFMAIRIFVNDEMNELYKGLKIVEDYMIRGGRLVAISFHSLEDKIVKRVLSGTDVRRPFGMSARQQARCPQEDTARIQQDKNWMVLKKKVVMPQFDEIDDNSRSRSAKLRAATRL